MRGISRTARHAAAEPLCAADTPLAVELEAGQTIEWCACGRSRTQPYCDGASHEGTGIEPVEWTVPRTRTYFLCRCKKTTRMPLCDGTHNFM